MPILTGQNAIVRTATVEIKTMHIGNKQVTLAVFRQLKVDDIIDIPTCHLNGVPWGTVNYFWGDCKEGTHLHVVWQKGTELRRCCLSSTPEGCWPGRRLAQQVESNRAYIHTTARLAAAVSILVSPEDYLARRQQWKDRKGMDIRYTLNGKSELFPVHWEQRRHGDLSDDALHEALRFLSIFDQSGVTRQSFAESAWRTIAAACAEGDLPSWDEAARPYLPTVFLTHLSEAIQIFQASHTAWATLVSSWRAHYTAIAALDQLFIAV